MTIAEEYIKLKRKTEFIVSDGNEDRLLAFVGSGGHLVFAGETSYIPFEHVAGFLNWIREVYGEGLDDQPMMKEVRDKHFPKIPVEGGGS